MPELPDVEGFRRVADNAVGQRLTVVEVIDPSVLRNTTGPKLSRRLVGHRFAPPARRGKWLVVNFDSPCVLIHFGMTGTLEWQPGDGDDDRHPHDRVVFGAEHGKLVYRDQRKLQGVWLAEDPDQAEAVIGEQGPDAMGLSWREFDQAMSRRRGALKTVLMDQTVVAGLGNLLTDEILWRARIHPDRRWSELDPQQRRALHRATRTATAASARYGRIPARRGWITSQRDTTRPVCPRCGGELRRERRGGRGSLWCPTCQPARSS